MKVRRNPDLATWAVSLAQPIVFALLPVVSLYASNLGEVQAVALSRALGLSMLASLLVFLATWLVAKDPPQAGTISAMVTILLFSYGHAYDSLKVLFTSSAYLVRHRYLVPLLIGLNSIWIMIVPSRRISQHGLRRTSVSQHVDQNVSTRKIADQGEGRTNGIVEGHARAPGTVGFREHLPPWE